MPPLDNGGLSLGSTTTVTRPAPRFEAGGLARWNTLFYLIRRHETSRGGEEQTTCLRPGVISFPSLENLPFTITLLVMGVVVIVAFLFNLPKIIEATNTWFKGKEDRDNDLRDVVDKLVLDRLEDRKMILQLTIELGRTQADLQALIEWLGSHASSATRQAFRDDPPQLMTVTIKWDC